MEHPQHPPIKSYSGKHMLAHKHSHAYTPNEPRFKIEELKRMTRNEKMILSPVMRIDEGKEVMPLYIVLQFENKNETKGKKRYFNMFDENVAKMFTLNILKNIEVLLTT